MRAGTSSIDLLQKTSKILEGYAVTENHVDDCKFIAVKSINFRCAGVMPDNNLKNPVSCPAESFGIVWNDGFIHLFKKWLLSMGEVVQINLAQAGRIGCKIRRALLRFRGFNVTTYPREKCHAPEHDESVNFGFLGVANPADRPVPA